MADMFCGEKVCGEKSGFFDVVVRRNAGCKTWFCKFTVRLAAFALLSLGFAERTWAAPFEQWFPGTSPKGAAVRVWGWGDEYSVRYEAEDGHAVVRDESLRAYFYARQDASGALVSTGIAVGDETDSDRAILATIPLHQADVSAAARERRLARIRRDDEETGCAARWARLKESARNVREAKKRGVQMAPPSSPTLGTVKGLTILIDFPISGSSATTWSTFHKNVTTAQLKSLLNDTNCKLYGNYSSVHDYYYDVSNGKLNYSMEVIGPIVAPYPRSHYDVSTRDNGECARELIDDVLSVIWNDAQFNTKYLPILQSLSTQDGDVRSLNFWFAGESATVWSYGLWAHKWWVGSTIYNNYKFTVGNKTMRFFNYQITPITSTPGVYTFCHENGHMLCGFPDLYSYKSSSNLGVGYFSLMYGSADKLNPPYIDPYLRAAAGWIEPQDLPTSGTVTVRNNHTDVWKYENPANSKEYYLIENRQQSGRDASIRASGILIWRCNEDGNNEDPQNLTGFGSNVHRLSNELSIEQADGDYDIEQAANTGDKWDSWYAGNSYSDGVFNDGSVPTAKWSDASASKLSLKDFSANGETMTFVVAGGSTPTRPVNDNFVNATAISGASGSLTASSANATKEAGEPSHGNSSATNSVWWKWTASAAGSMTITTVGSNFDTGLAVYTGSSVSKLEKIDEDDDGAGSRCSSVTFSVAVGTTYYIAVAGYQGATGTVKLNWNLTPTYSVVYNRGTYGTGSQQTATKTQGVALTLMGVIFTRTGYTQTGWSTSSTGNSKTYSLGASYKTDAAITLYPYWTANTYSVSYSLGSNGSHGSWHPGSATYDTPFYVSAPTRAGYTFAGWTVTNGLNTSTAKWGTGSSPSTAIGTSTRCKNGEAGNVYFKNLTPIANGSVTLTANWDVATIPLATALDNTKLTFTTGGDADWFGQSDTTHDGTDAVRSGKISDNGSSWLQTTVTGPGIISFWWYVSSEDVRYDYLEFLDGTSQLGKIGGTSASWTKRSFLIGAGSHTLKWNYRKDGSVSKGLDAGFVDQVEWTDNVVTGVEDQHIPFVSGGGIYALTLKNGGEVAFLESWLTDAGISTSGGITASLLNAIGRNGLPRYQSLLFGFDPESTIPAEEQLKATIEFDANGRPVISCVPRNDNDLIKYTTFGKPSLDTAEWTKVETDSDKAKMKFFKVKVELAD